VSQMPAGGGGALAQRRAAPAVRILLPRPDRFSFGPEEAGIQWVDRAQAEAFERASSMGNELGEVPGR